jgi:3-hydroxyacyl-CoA dehydrogenase/enoyl-CoA hydratase/3-hydroxybutyryl-CoA epimerase
MTQSQAAGTISSVPCVQSSILESGVAILKLGQDHEAVVTLNADRLGSLDKELQRLQSQKVKAIIIAGPSEQMFSVGADIAIIDQVRDPAEGRELATIGQSIFDRLERLGVPTVAAISGPCIGGALELALACTVRIASDRPNTIIGLPETKIGIIPGFGGTQRLPRLIGLPKALSMILPGRTLRAEQAMNQGIISEIVPSGSILKRAEELILQGPRRRSAISIFDLILTFTSFGRNRVKQRALKQIAEETQGFYPAPGFALDACLYGLEHGMAEGLQYEADLLGKAIVTEECKSLVKAFFLTEAAKSLSKGARKDVEGIHAAVLGAGPVGIQHTATLAQHEIPVVLKDSSSESVSRAIGTIRDTLKSNKRLSEADRSFIINRIVPTTTTPATFGTVQFILEALDQPPEATVRALLDIAGLIPPTAVVGLTIPTSPISQLIAEIPHPERILGFHTIQSLPRYSLVEIVRTRSTSHRAIAVAAALAIKLGHYPIVVDDGPGFLVQRMLAAYYAAALALFTQGYSVESIDTAAMRFGMPRGPFRAIDSIGIDTFLKSASYLQSQLGERMAVPYWAKNMADLGYLGEKNKSGFYIYDEPVPRPDLSLREALKLDPPRHPLESESYIATTLIYCLINEAVRCFDEGVAGAPGVEAGFQIDLASVMGCGFPPFRGGILHYADRIGAKPILHHLCSLERAHGLQFEATKGLAQRSASGKSFYEIG